MATSVFKDIDKDLNNNGFVMEGPFHPKSIGDGHFLVQHRRKGEEFLEMYTGIVRIFDEVIMIGHV